MDYPKDPEPTVDYPKDPEPTVDYPKGPEPTVDYPKDPEPTDDYPKVMCLIVFFVLYFILNVKCFMLPSRPGLPWKRDVQSQWEYSW